MTRHYILLAVSAFLYSFSLGAQSIHWSIYPSYTAAEPLSDRWIRVADGKGWGIVSAGGEVVRNCEYSSITDFQEGYCLLLKEDRLLGTFSTDGTFRPFQELYIDPSYPYFSEGLLAVRDVSSSWTYMTPEGKFPIRNVFQYAGPFSHGLAVVREKNGEGSYLHIDKKGQVSILSSEYADNFLIFASSFTDLGGQAGALVVDGHSQVSLRSLGGGKLLDFGRMKTFDKQTQVLTTREYEIVLADGRFIKSRKRIADGSVKSYARERNRSFTASVPALSFPTGAGLLGVSLNGKVLLEPQFVSVVALSENSLLARRGRMFGLLAIDKSEQAPSLRLNSEMLIVRHPSDLVLSGNWILPASVPLKDARMTLLESGGASRELELGNASFSFPVTRPVKDKVLEVNVILSLDGLKYPPVHVSLPVEYRNGFTVTAPSQVTLQQGNEKAAFSIQIKNEANVPASACDILVDGRLVMSQERLGAGEWVTIPLSFSVNLEDMDSVSREIKVEIREKDVPAYETPKRVTFNRNFN